MGRFHALAKSGFCGQKATVKAVVFKIHLYRNILVTSQLHTYVVIVKLTGTAIAIRAPLKESTMTTHGHLLAEQWLAAVAGRAGVHLLSTFCSSN